MAYSPYQAAGSQASLYDLMQKSKFGEQQARTEGVEKKLSLKEEFDEQLRKAQRKARKRGGLFKGLNING